MHHTEILSLKVAMFKGGRSGIEAMAALPTARREPKSKGCEYERQLKVWKRRRTIARAKVAKYARLVRYHNKSREKQPTDQ